MAGTRGGCHLHPAVMLAVVGDQRSTAVGNSESSPFFLVLVCLLSGLQHSEIVHITYLFLHLCIIRHKYQNPPAVHMSKIPRKRCFLND